MPRYKPQDHNSLLLPVILSEQIVPGTFAFALSYLVDHELNLRPLDAQFNNDEVGASAYDPRVMLKIVLLAYSQGLISSRNVEQACARNVQFIAISGDSHSRLQSLQRTLMKDARRGLHSLVEAQHHLRNPVDLLELNEHSPAQVQTFHSSTTSHHTVTSTTSKSISTNYGVPARLATRAALPSLAIWAMCLSYWPTRSSGG